MDALLRLVVVGLASVGLGFGQDGRVEAFIEPNPVELGQQFVLSVEVSGTALEQTQDPILPPMDAFARFQGSQSSQKVQIVNGRMSSTRTLSFFFTAGKAGTFDVGPVKVAAGGQIYQTEPIRLSIGGPSSQSSTPGTPSDGRELFVTAVANKERVFQNEAAVITYRIHTRVGVSSYSFANQPETTGLWLQEYELPESPTTRTQVINGRRYTVAIIKRMAVFPASPGDKEVGPLQIECQVRAQRPRPRSLFDNFFQDSWLGRPVSRVVESPPVRLKVDPLPTRDRPIDFSGAVGSFQVTTELESAGARANEAMTLRIRVRGEGNLQHINDPELQLPDSFETYSPQSSQSLTQRASGVSGEKTFEYVVIPRRAGEFELAPFQLAYFDPRQEVYRVAAADPIKLDVLPGEEGLSVDGSSLSKRELELVGQDIRFIKTGRSQLVSRQSGSGRVWALALGPGLAVGAALGLRRRRDRLAGDVGYARDRRARRLARKRLGKAAALLDGADAGSFYAEVDRALTGFIADKLNVSEAGMLTRQIETRLGTLGVEPEIVEEFLECRSVCDLNRFSPLEGDRVQRREVLARVETALATLDGALSRAG